MNVSGSLWQQWVQWDFCVHRKSGRQLRVQREMTHSRCGAAGKCDTHLRFNHAYQTSHFSGNFFRGLPDILWAPIQSSARDGKEEEMLYAAPLLLFNWDSILNFKCSWFYIFLTLHQFWHAASAEWQRGRGKVPGFGLTVVLIASCSLFHVLPWGESNLTTFPIVSTGYIHNPTVVRINWRARCE